MTILGIGNILQKDDGFGVYASSYLKANYDFSPKIEIINGGVEGINLFSVFEESDNVLILDSIQIDDKAGSIYLIPATELSGHGLNSGGAHEIGVLQCLDMLELQGKRLPKSNVLGMVPEQVTFDIALSATLTEAFGGYIQTVLKTLEKEGVEIRLKKQIKSLASIIFEVKKI